jgi:DNA-binding NarL/FixJ family response regulator
MPYRIVLADDHATFRESLKRVCGEIVDVEIIGEAGDGLELLDFLDRAKSTPHMILLDISMPKLHGLEVTRRIKRVHADIKVLILTIHKDKEYLRQALAAGAEGYLLKEDLDGLVSAIDAIRKGDVFVSPSFVMEDR